MAVTPCVGVWIETHNYNIDVTSSMSHPAWVCGLKPFINVTAITGNSHTLRGCVD